MHNKAPQPVSHGYTYASTEFDVLAGGFERWELDRDPGGLLRDFLPLDDLNPYGYALDRLASRGEVAILDAGCGTGRAIAELQEGLARQAGGLQNVWAVGLNAEDHSSESELADVRNAIKEKRVDYVVDLIESGHLPHDIFDVVYSYEVLVHAGDQAAVLVEALDKAVKPGGALYFNVKSEQKDSEAFQRLMHLFADTHDIKSYEKQNRTKTQSRVFYRLVKDEPIR